MRRRRHDDDNGPDIIQDGQKVTVPMMLMDSARLALRHRYDTQRVIDAKLHGHGRYAAHRPHCVADALGSVMSDSLNNTLADAVAARDRAFADLCQRSQNAWKRPFRDAPALNAMPPSPPEPAAQWDPDEDGDNNADLEDARRARDEAYNAQYARELWRNPPNPYASNRNLSGQNSGVLDPTRASTIQAQGMRWRHGA
jgi:hypothetical protein